MNDKLQILLSQSVISAFVATITGHFGLLCYMLIVFCVSMILDFLSGMAAATKESIENPEDNKKGLNSRIGLLGIFKKLGYICAVCVAVMVDVLINKMAIMLGVHMPLNTFFSLLVTTWFILNELLSIIENAGRMGAEVPGFLKNIISVLKDTVDEKGDVSNE